MRDVIAGLTDQRIDLVLGASLGGIGRHVRTLCEAMSQQRVTAVVHTSRQTSDRFDFAATGALVDEVQIPDGFAPLRGMAAARSLRPQLGSAHLVHAHGFRAGLISAQAVRRHRRKRRPQLLVTWHNVPEAPRVLSGVQRKLEQQLARTADVSLAVSPDLVERISAAGGHDVRLVPAGAERLPDPDMPSDDIRAQLSAIGRPLVLAVGRLHAQKGIDVLLDAATGWQHRTPRPLLVIAGDGPDRHSLEEQSVRNDVEVRWLGYVGDRARLASLFAAADAVVLPSRWEGSPLAVHEALMAGRPVVTTPVGGLPTLLAPDEACFVPVGDAAALGKAVGDLLDETERGEQLAERGRRAGVRWPDAGATADGVLRIYADLLRP